MSNVSKVNWDLARALFLQGVQIAIIAEQCNVKPDTLRKRALRQNWSLMRDNLKRELSQAGKSPIGITLPSVSEMGATVRQLAAAGLLKASEGLDTIKAPKSLKSRKELAETVKAITDPGKTVFAWEEQKPTVIIDLGQLKSARRPGDLEIDSQVVDSEANPPKLTDAPKQPPEAGPNPS